MNILYNCQLLDRSKIITKNGYGQMLKYFTLNNRNLYNEISGSSEQF